MIIYVLPILLNGMEVLLPTGRNLENLELVHRKTLKQLLTLPNNVPESAIFTILGAEPIQSLIHKKVLTLLRNMCDQDDSTEKELIRRQLCLKDFHCNSWISFVRTILAPYNLPSLHDILNLVSSK